MILLVVIILFGCSDKDSVKKIEFRKGIIYTLDGDKPYTGEGVSYYKIQRVEVIQKTVNRIKNGSAIFIMERRYNIKFLDAFV